MKGLILFLLLIPSVTGQGACQCLLKECPENCESDLWVCNDNICERLPPVNTWDWITSAFVFVSIVLASLAGIGGSGMITTALLLSGEFGIDYTLPLTVSMVFTSTLLRFLVFLKQRDPLFINEPIIYFPIILISTPVQVIGSLIGIALNNMSPDWFILLSICVILSITTYKTLKKGYGMSNDTVDPENPETSVEEIELSKLELPWLMILFIFLIPLSSFGLTLLRGGPLLESPFGIESCDKWYWGISGIIVAIYLVVTVFASKHIMTLDTHELDWTAKGAFRFSLIILVISSLSTFMGIGGGMLMGPLLLYLGMSTENVVATSTAMTFISASVSLIQYSMTGNLLVLHVVWYAGLSLVASALGQLLYYMYIQKSGRRKTLVYILGGLIGVTAVLLVMTGIIRLVRNGISFEIYSAC